MDPAAATSTGASSPLGATDRERVVAWRGNRPITLAGFVADVRAIAAALPASGSAINLCEDRYAFIASFCAVGARGQTTLLPPSRTRDAVDCALAAHPGSYVLTDTALDPSPEPLVRLPVLRSIPAGCDDFVTFDPATVVAIGFTSGSTGQPKANAKTWLNFDVGSRLNADVLVPVLGLADGSPASIVATVPPQHMYGMEMSVLLPLFGPFAVHAGKPFFAADIATALAEVPAPRMLVTTPVHLRAILADRVQLPPVAAIVSATAPLPQGLAVAAEARFGAPLIELFGSTETCVIAHRRAAVDSAWRLHPGVRLRPQPDGTLVEASHLSQPVLLQDLVELLPDARFILRGRNADLLEIAGKRASLSDLTRRLLALDGVVDAVVFQLDDVDARGIQRVAALAVAPTRDPAELLAALRDQIDPVFLPRPLRRVDRLPRNETGKLPRSELLAALAAAAR
ncbi:MAG: acyl-CoA synthetase [Xanthomonadales bacterium]|nr:acyl-CoA synthetase [Xanthomonadales bacterium]